MRRFGVADCESFALDKWALSRRKAMARVGVLGVDGGTESLRAIVFDAASGDVISTASSPYVTTFPAPGWHATY